MTRRQALLKSAKMLEQAENNAYGDQLVSKYLTLAQLYMSLAQAIGDMNSASV